VTKSNVLAGQCIEMGQAISQKREEWGIWRDSILKFH
jgi:hypothetical protein